MASMEENLAYFVKNGRLNVSPQKRKEMLTMLDGELKRREKHVVVGRHVGDAVNKETRADEDFVREQRIENFKKLRNKPYPIDEDDNDDDFKHAEQMKKNLAAEIETEQRQLKVKQLEEKIENLKREHFASLAAKENDKPWAGIPINLIFALLIIAVGIIKFVVFSDATKANVGTAQVSQQSPQTISNIERETLLALDQRRVELEARSQGLDKKEIELVMQDRIVAEKIAELKSIYGQLQARRQEIDHKREAKLEQLAEVYSTMAPEQAAPIIAKLDNETALSLLQRMSGKRMGQILSSMNSDRAIELTKGLRG